jgi:hypothetical protein
VIFDVRKESRRELGDFHNQGNGELRSVIAVLNQAVVHRVG